MWRWFNGLGWKRCTLVRTMCLGRRHSDVRRLTSHQQQSRLAANHRERLRLIEGDELKHLLAEHLGLDVRIGLDRKLRRRR